MLPDATSAVDTCSKFEVDMTFVPELRRLQLSTSRQLKVPIFHFGGVNEPNFKFHFLTPKRLFIGVNNVLRIEWRIAPGGVSREATCGRGERTKK